MKRVLSIILCLALTLEVSPVLAGLNDELEEAFNSMGFATTGTAGGGYKGQTRGYLTTGSFTARRRPQIIQPLTLTSPSIKAGCGGISLFAGGFSFINKDEFETFIRNIGQAAIGYGVSLALEVACPTCMGVIKWLRSTMNTINNMALDSCTTAKALVNTTGDAVGLWNLESCKLSRGAETTAGGGTRVDPVSGWINCAADQESSVKQQIRNATSEATTAAYSSGQKRPSRGATTVEALRKRKDLSDEERKLIMGLLGTYYSKDASDDGSCSYLGPTLTFVDLVRGGGPDWTTKLRLPSCSDGAALQPNTAVPCQDVTVSDQTYDSFANKARTKLKGIYTKVKNRQTLQTAATDNPEQEFVSSISVVPVLSLMQTLRQINNDDASDAMIDDISDIIGIEMAWQQVRKYIQMMKEGLPNVTACAIDPTDMAEQIRNVEEAQIGLYQQAIAKWNIKQVQVQNLITMARMVDEKASANLKNIGTK